MTDPLNITASPDMLNRNVKHNVRRINKMPVVLFGVVIIIVLVTLVYAVIKRGQHAQISDDSASANDSTQAMQQVTNEQAGVIPQVQLPQNYVPKAANQSNVTNNYYYYTGKDGKTIKVFTSTDGKRLIGENGKTLNEDGQPFQILSDGTILLNNQIIDPNNPMASINNLPATSAGNIQSTTNNGKDITGLNQQHNNGSNNNGNNNGLSNNQNGLLNDNTIATEKQRKEIDKELERLRALKISLYESALKSSTKIQTPNNSDDNKNPTDALQALSNLQNLSRGLNTTPANNAQNANLALLASQVTQDSNKQGTKQAFFDKVTKTGYLNEPIQEPLSEFEIKTGTVLPAVMITGIVSDLPGQIIGQISQNVYDTATGHYLLIPQGTRLFGAYSSDVSFGQERVLVTWNRLIFPNASTINIENMGGSDQAGYSGFHDIVNNHYLRTFGGSILLSVFSAATQQSQSTGNAEDEDGAGQRIAAAIGQQFGELGSNVTKKYLDVQPTIEIRSGYRFNVIVNKDMILKPYEN